MGWLQQALQEVVQSYTDASCDAAEDTALQHICPRIWYLTEVLLSNLFSLVGSLSVHGETIGRTPVIYSCRHMLNTSHTVPVHLSVESLRLVSSSITHAGTAVCDCVPPARC